MTIWFELPRRGTGRRCAAKAVAGFLVGLAAVIGGPAWGQWDISWDQKFYDPVPGEDGHDLILPMPCGGAMAFRPVAMAGADIADDVAVPVGEANSDYGFQEGRRTAYFAAPFSDPEDPKRHVLYMGKYEVTADQYAAIRGTCPRKPSIKGRIPALGIGWFDAVHAADAYSRWLLAHAANSLPRDGEGVGFVRLPTETEWEYAVRGGLRVTSSEFVARTFPTPDGGMTAYAWSVEPTSANGKPKPVGLRRPNPIGLHDMLGNADEIVFDPFRLVHVDRRHGLVGGYVIRGGNYLTPEANLRSAYRTEVPFYRGGQPGVVPTAGIRFAISVAIVSSREKLREIQTAWEGLAVTTPPAPPPQGKDLPAVQADPIKELQVLTDLIEEPALQTRLQRVVQDFRVAIDDRNRARDKSARSLLRQGGIIFRELGDDAAVIRLAAELIQKSEKTGVSSSLLSQLYAKQEQREAALARNVRGYADLVVEVAEAFTASVVADQRRVLATRLREDGLNELLEKVDQFTSHVGEYRRQGTVDVDALKGDLK